MSVAGLGHDSRAVANKILENARAKGRSLTMMQLVKLIYFAQGWSLALADRPLTYHPAQAWQYGPVYPHVYKAFPNSGSQPLEGLVCDKSSKKPVMEVFDDDEDEIIDWVVDNYGPMHAFELSRRTHAEDGPWKLAIETGGTYSEIPQASMKAYFKTFVK